MSKFTPLTKFLAALPVNERRMTFAEIEELLGFPLRSSARRHRAWWSNNPTNSAMTKAWLSAGFKTEQVDMGGETLVFRRASPAAKPDGKSGNKSDLPTKQPRSPIGGLEGTVRVAPGVDLTEPTGERWNAEEGRII